MVLIRLWHGEANSAQGSGPDASTDALMHSCARDALKFAFQCPYLAVSNSSGQSVLACNKSDP